MTTKQLLNINPGTLQSMNRKKLAKVVSALSSTANKRRERLIKAGYEKNIPDKYGVRDKNLNQLRSEYVRVSQFLRQKTSTVSGRKKIEKDIEKRIGGNLVPSDADRFWGAYARIEEAQPAFLQRYGSERMQQFLYETMIENNIDMEELIKQGLESIKDFYEEDAVKENGDFFEIFRTENI